MHSSVHQQQETRNNNQHSWFHLQQCSAGSTKESTNIGEADDTPHADGRSFWVCHPEGWHRSWPWHREMEGERDNLQWVSFVLMCVCVYKYTRVCCVLCMCVCVCVWHSLWIYETWFKSRTVLVLRQVYLNVHPWVLEHVYCDLWWCCCDWAVFKMSKIDMGKSLPLTKQLFLILVSSVFC